MASMGEVHAQMLAGATKALEAAQLILHAYETTEESLDLVAGAAEGSDHYDLSVALGTLGIVRDALEEHIPQLSLAAAYLQDYVANT